MEFWNNPRLKEILRMLEESAPGSFLVGGAVRDFVLGRERPFDLDVAVRGDGFRLALSVAERLSNAVTFVPLDENRSTGRLVVERGEAGTVDIAPLKGETITADLFARDFTINAIAIRVTDLLEETQLRIFDPTGGCDDLAAGRIRACSKDAFHQDPLRVLRAFRFRAELGFQVTVETLEMIGPILPSLSRVAGERIRDEFAAILCSELAWETVVEMDRYGVLESLFPELSGMKGAEQNTYHHLDVWEHTLETIHELEILVERTEELFPAVAPKVAEYLRGEPVKDRSRLALLKLAAFFHDAGKPLCSTVDPDGRIRFIGHEKISRGLFTAAGRRLKLASREMDVIGEWISGHMRTMIFTADSVSTRSLHRLHMKYGQDVIGLLLLFLADLSASQGPARPPEESDHALAQVRWALDLYFDYDEKPPPRLLTGRDLIDLFGIVPGPFVGEVLRWLAELQAVGEVVSREDAVNAVRRYLAEERPK